MPKPTRPYQPFIEVRLEDRGMVLFDRIFISQDIQREDSVDAEGFCACMHKLTSKSGYLFTKDDLIAAYGFKDVADQDAVITLNTNSESMGYATVDYKIIGMKNFIEDLNQNDLSAQQAVGGGTQDDCYAPSEVTVSAFISEVATLNQYRQAHNFLESKVAIMLLPSSDKAMTASKCDWMHYHINNFMMRGYALFVEKDTQTGRDICQYLLDSCYEHFTLVLSGEVEAKYGDITCQPIEACLHNGAGEKTIETVMEYFCDYRLDPSLDEIKSSTPLSTILKSNN